MPRILLPAKMMPEEYCIYCGKRVLDEHFKGCRKKEYDKRKKLYILSEWYHLECMPRGQEYKQEVMNDGTREKMGI